MGCSPVLSAANGPVPCDVMLIGEAPGRLGAGRTGVPFSGDVAGQRLGTFLVAAGLQRDDVFITNAALCLPLTPSGLNRRPTNAEIRNCSTLLSQTLDIVRPKLVMTMGGTALSATRLIEPHALTLANAGERPVPWRGTMIAVTYHPGARSQVHRKTAAQLADWRAVGESVRDR